MGQVGSNVRAVCPTNVFPPGWLAQYFRSMREAPRILVLLLMAALAACGGRSDTSDPFERAEDPTWLEVENRASQDMTIYVIREGGARQRLGSATAHSSTRLRIPDRLIFGATPLAFEADPIGSRRTSFSERITVRPGDTVLLQIPPG